MNLITKRLSTLPIGSEVQVSYGFMEGQTLIVTGVVTDNDCTTALEIRDKNGNIHYVDYSTIKFFMVVQQAQEQPVPVPAPVPTSYFHDKKPEHLSLGVSDQELKKLFASLNKQEKQLLQKGCDSFFYGVCTTSHEKMRSAAETARRIIYQEADDGMLWSRDAIRLAALLLCRTGVCDAELFTMAEMWEEAAVCHYRNMEPEDAGICAALALLDQDHPAVHTQDMLIILEGSCRACNDISVLPRLLDAGVYITTLVKDLALAQGRPATGTGETLEALTTCYPNTQMEEVINEITAPQIEPVRLGRISKLLWVNNSGTISYWDDREQHSVPFRYADIQDSALLAAAKTASSGCSMQELIVRFLVKDGKAVEIQQVSQPVKEAQACLQAGNFEEAVQLCQLQADSGKASGALALMAEAAVISDEGHLLELALDYCESHREEYPVYGKALSQLAQLHQKMGHREQAIALTDQALADKNMPATQRSYILCQYMSFSMTAYNETDDTAFLRNILPKADAWLDLYNSQLSGNSYWAKKYPRVLKWKLRSLCALDQPDAAEEIYGMLVRQFPQESKLALCLEEIRQAQARVKTADPAPVVTPTPIPTLLCPPAEAEEEPAMDVPTYQDTAGWDALGFSKDAYMAQAMAFDGPGRLAPMLAWLKTGSMLNPELAGIYQAVSHAVNNPLEYNRYDTDTLVRLLSQCDDGYAELNRCCISASYLRTLFQCHTAPFWIRQSLPLFDQIPQLEAVSALIQEFRRETGHAPDRYAAYRSPDLDARRQLQADLIGRAQHLYDIYMASAPRDSVSFARLIQTKKLAYGSLKSLLSHVINANQEALEAARDGFCKQFLTDNLLVSPEKVDCYIIANWEVAGKLIPSRDSATLQGSRRNSLRNSLTAILSVIRDCYRLMDCQEELPVTAEGLACFSTMEPRLEKALDELASVCRELSSGAGNTGERSGLFLLGYTAAELRDKLTGQWKMGQERYLFCDFLKTSHICLDEEFMPDLSATLCAYGPVSLVQRILSHAHAEKLEFQEYMDRVFSRERSFQNFQTAEQLVRYAALSGASVTVPEHPERYVNQAKLMAELDFEELMNALDKAGSTAADRRQLEELERILLHFYDRCCRELRFGFLADLMDVIRTRLHNLKEVDAA